MESNNLKNKPKCDIHDVSNSCCGWISVKDKLPDFGKPCLVFKKNKYPQIEIASLHKISDQGGEFVIPFSGCKEVEFNNDITHWQYLPKPPRQYLPKLPRQYLLKPPSAKDNCC